MLSARILLRVGVPGGAKCCGNNSGPYSERYTMDLREKEQMDGEGPLVTCKTCGCLSSRRPKFLLPNTFMDLPLHPNLLLIAACYKKNSVLTEK